MEGHCAPKYLLSPVVAGTRHTTAKSHRETHTNKLRACQKRPEQNRSPILEESAKKPDSCGRLGASVQLELQRLDVGHLEPKMPPVSQRYTCSRRKEWLRGWGWMARMGGHEGGAPHPGLSTQLCSSVVVAGCTCQTTSQERVRVWGGV